MRVWNFMRKAWSGDFKKKKKGLIGIEMLPVLLLLGRGVLGKPVTHCEPLSPLLQKSDSISCRGQLRELR